MKEANVGIKGNSWKRCLHHKALRAAIDDAKMKTLLNLKDTQHAHLELPIGYSKE